MAGSPQIPVIFVPSEYLTDMFISNDVSTGVLTFIRPFQPWYRLFPGEEMNQVVDAVNELILRLNLNMVQRVITDPGDIDIEPGDVQVLIDKTVPQATTVYLPSVTEFVERGYNFAPVLIKDLAQNAGTFNITIVPDGADTIDKLATWTLAADGAAISLRALNDMTGWYVA